MEFRMIPLGTLATQLERTVRSTAETCGKLVDFAIEGGHVALDKSLLEQMSDPLLHLLRNCRRSRHRDAGTPRRRRQARARAASPSARSHEGTDVLIEVEDDGAGLDARPDPPHGDRAGATSTRRGRGDERRTRSSRFIFEPGFSTADRVTEVSGRGVGMDVVKAKVDAPRAAASTSPRGLAPAPRSSMRVPMTLAITRILLVRAGGQTFGAAARRGRSRSRGRIRRPSAMVGCAAGLHAGRPHLSAARPGRIAGPAARRRRAGRAAGPDRQPLAPPRRARRRRDRQQPRRGGEDARHAPAPRATACGAPRCSATAPWC